MRYVESCDRKVIRPRRAAAPIKAPASGFPRWLL